MQCRTCQYRLDRISGHRCPECGAEFNPGDPDSYLDPSTSAYGPGEMAFVALALGILLVVQLVFGYIIEVPSLLRAGLWFLVPATMVLLFGMSLIRIRVRGRILMLATLPGWIIIAGIGTLAIHMRVALGGWPPMNGTAEFSDLLRGHATLAMMLFAIGILLALPALALGVVTLFIRRIRTAAMLLAIFALSINCCMVFIDLLPKGFRDWWWD